MARFKRRSDLPAARRRRGRGRARQPPKPGGPDALVFLGVPFQIPDGFFVPSHQHRPPEGAKPAQRKAVAKEVLGPLVNRAFRRPVRPDELERYAKLVDVAMTEGDSFERGLQLALQALLCSTPFLYRFEDARP